MNNLYHLRLANVEDRKEIMSFIQAHWMDTHILAHDTEFFNYQYMFGEELQFILALGSDAKIKGILGYIQYAPKSIEQDIFLALWKVIPNQSDHTLGIKLLQYLIENIKHRHIYCVGINKKSTGIYKFLGYQTGKLDHYVAFNPDCTKYLISNPPSLFKKIKLNCKYEFRRSKDVEELLVKLKDTNFYHKKVPFKSLEFISHRYKDHPYYSYIFYEVVDKGLFIGIAVLREVSYKKSLAIRIIDVIAANENVTLIINDLASILNDSDYEYIDVYASGLSDKILLSGNYEQVTNSKDMIVPDHFSPFKKSNTDILFTTSYTSKIVLFKGDGDQDQPRLADFSGRV